MANQKEWAVRLALPQEVYRRLKMEAASRLISVSSCAAQLLREALKVK